MSFPHSTNLKYRAVQVYSLLYAAEILNTGLLHKDEILRILTRIFLLVDTLLLSSVCSFALLRLALSAFRSSLAWPDCAFLLTMAFLSLRSIKFRVWSL